MATARAAVGGAPQVNIWVDADACPGPIKEILFRAARRAKVPLTLVANHALRTPPSTLIRAVQVAGGFDVADDYIAQHAGTGDLVITADIPLAAAVIGNGCRVLDPRGELYTSDNIGERHRLRNFMQELRSSGVATGGPAPLSHRDRQCFANSLDRLLNEAAR